MKKKYLLIDRWKDVLIDKIDGLINGQMGNRLIDKQMFGQMGNRLIDKQMFGWMGNRCLDRWETMEND